MSAGEPILYSLFVYAPNKGAPIFFTVSYAISAFFHIFQCYRFNAWKLIGLHALCGVLFTVGYALREYNAYNYKYIEGETPKSVLLIYIMNQVFVMICPPLLELANYHVLGRVFYYVPDPAPLEPSNVLGIFGGLMGLVEALNAVGVALSSNPAGQSSSQHTGSILTITAVAIQIVVICSFLCIAGLFWRRCAKANVLKKNVLTVLSVLFVSMFLILVRCIYRIVEHTANTNIKLDSMEALRSLTPLLRYETFFYVFEAGLMLLNSILWNVFHPGRFIPTDRSRYIGPDGVEIQDPAGADSRHMFSKAVNMATFGVLCRRNTTKAGLYRNNSEDSELPAVGQAV